jgi:hypothetical protein
MENCLINPSGKIEGFMACDFYGEWVVREVKRMMHHNLNDVTARFLYEVIGVQVNLFRDVRKKMAEETDAPKGGFHSSSVSTKNEVELVADEMLARMIGTFQAGRGKDDPEMDDLYGKGMTVLARGAPILKYIEKLELDQGIIHSEEFSGQSEEQEDVELPQETEFAEESSDEEWLDV